MDVFDDLRKRLDDQFDGVAAAISAIAVTIAELHGVPEEEMRQRLADKAIELARSELKLNSQE